MHAVDEQVNYDLTLEDQDAMTQLAEVVEANPEAIRQVIRDQGIDPASDEAGLAIQLVMISSATQNFDDQFETMVTTHNFSTKGWGKALGAGIKSVFKKGSIKTMLGKIKNVFKKKKGGSKVGNFFKNLFKNKKRRQEEAAAQVLEQAQEDPGARFAREEEGPTETEEEKKKREEEEAEKKKKKQMMLYGGIAIGVVVLIIIIALVMRAKKKK